MRALSILCLTVLAAAACRAQADTTVQIVSLEPANSTTLIANEPFYVHVKYSTDKPVNLWAYPYFHGKLVKTMLAGASSKYTGNGETVGWFSLTEPGKVDEIRIVVGGGEPWKQWPVASRRLNLVWVAEPPAPQAAEAHEAEPRAPEASVAKSTS